MDMDLFARYDELTDIIERMNAEAVKRNDLPYIRLHDYVHYMDVKDFLQAYTRRLRLSAEERSSLLRFCCRDTLELKTRAGERDLYALTFHYFKAMVVRTGNLDTPDDCVEKLDMDRFVPYRNAREKQWRNAVLSREESDTLTFTEKKILGSMKV